MKHHFLKCLPVHVRSVTRGGMAKLEWSEVVCLADQVFKDYVPSDLPVDMEPKVEIDGELNRMRIGAGRPRGKFNGNCNYCGIYGHNEVECRKKREGKSGQNNNDSFKNRYGYGNGRGKNVRPNYQHHNESEKAENYNARAYTVQLSDKGCELDELEQFNMLELKTSVNGLAKLSGTTNGCALNMLIDGGASHSFINMNVLPKAVVDMIETGASGLDIVKREYSLEMATETRTISCFIGRFLIKIDEWIGEQLFVVSRDLSSEHCFIGKDFLKKNRVLVDHYNDKILIRSESCVPTICANKINCVVQKAVKIEPHSEKLIYAKFGKMELNRTMIFESNPILDHKGIKLACSLHQVEKHTEQILVSALNATTDTVKLEPNEIVGFLEEAGDVFVGATFKEEKGEVEVKRSELEPSNKIHEMVRKNHKKEDWLKVENGENWLKIKELLKVINGVLVVKTSAGKERVLVPSHAVPYIMRIYQDYE
ncbi:hypothetical protein BpHYR1_051240 [Brachionus plicatilis]|uniref:Uncharacterized protein n=1 Tax=Brachionus plicatilis TaxID=10195 RepID=A0A3M7RE03_BRAPC|nr:hypothetical protein BpHYR1_051240 [Brachionus plicatilis]